MNDNEIVAACAEAVGWRHIGPMTADQLHEYGQHPCKSGGNDYWIAPGDKDPTCIPCFGLPNPLRDDAQCLALIKHFKLPVGFNSGWGCVMRDESGLPVSGAYHYEELNRAVCVCIAGLPKSFHDVVADRARENRT